MLRVINVHEEREAAAFAADAAKHFADHPSHFTYARGDEPASGELFAVRWNPYTVLVVRVHDSFCPSLYDTGALSIGKLPPLKPTD